MKSSHAKKLSITLPDALEKELRKAAKGEHRTLSGVLHEAARLYIHTKQWEKLQREIGLKAAALGIHTEDDVDDMIHDLRAGR